MRKMRRGLYIFYGNFNGNSTENGFYKATPLGKIGQYNGNYNGKITAFSVALA